MPSPTDAEEPKPQKPAAAAVGYADLMPEPEPEGADAQNPAAPAAQPAATANNPAAPAATAHKHSATVLRAARQLGVSEARIAASTPEQLDALTESLLEQRQAEYEAAEAARTRQQPAAAVEEEDIPDYDFGEDLDADIAKRINAGIKAQAKAVAARENAKTQAAIAELRQAEQSRQSRANAKVIDKGFAKINSPLLGGSAELHEITDAMVVKRRKIVVDSIVADPIKGLSIADAIAQRCTELFGVAASETPPAKNGKKPVVTPEQWAEAGVARPTGTKVPDTETGEQAAKQAVRQLISERRGHSASGSGIEVAHNLEDDEVL